MSVCDSFDFVGGFCESCIDECSVCEYHNCNYCANYDFEFNRCGIDLTILD